MTVAEEPKNVYHHFVPDQVLTSDNLNHQFAYLDNQQRQTRTQLIGTGIACGLQIITGSVGANLKITITQGVGVTSEGYLVTMPENGMVYLGRSKDDNKFNALKCKYYDKFVNEAATGNTQRFDIWELKESATAEDSEPLTSAFLNGKIVLLFVELLEENNKNCDPTSCDEKGTKVTVTIKPLLVDADNQNVKDFLLESSGSLVTGKAVLLPTINMKRFDVPASTLVDAVDIYNVYKNILTPGFIISIKDMFNAAYGKLSSLISVEYDGTEFNGLAGRFSILQNTPVLRSTQLRVQYYYDFLSDLLLAYEELRQKAFELVCDCVPDETLFPRHLLLGEAKDFNESTTVNRTRFTPSCAVSCCAGAETEINFLYQRMVLMVRNFSEPPFENSTTRPVKITPSLIGISPLSERAIPFYYTPSQGTKKLSDSWNRKRTLTGSNNAILHYDTVPDPFQNDIEPYNFFRIEGHIGLEYEDALDKVQTEIYNNRIPVKVMVLKTGTFNTDSVLQNDVSNIVTGLETEYAIVAKQWKSVIERVNSIYQQRSQYLALFTLAQRVVIETALNNIRGITVLLPESFLAFIRGYANFNTKKQLSFTQAVNVRQITFSYPAGNNFAEDITDCLDEFLQLSDKSSSHISALDILYNEFTSRSADLYSNIYFTHFIKKHPGVQHKGGASSGGTFIMVYKGELSTIRGPFRLRGIITGSSFFVFNVVRIRNTNNQVVILGNNNFNLTTDTLPFTLEVFSMTGAIVAEKEFTTAEDAASFITVDVANRRITLATGTGSVNTNQVRSGMVVADFYLPYTCCGDGTPVEFIIQRPEKPTCDLPCDGITEITQYEWPTSAGFIDELMRKRKNYFFTVAEYVLNGKSLLTDGPLAIEVYINDDMGGIGNQMIFEAINSNFPTGLVFNLSEKPTQGRGIPFTVKRFQCHSFTLTIIDTDKPSATSTRYTYSEKGMLMNNEPFQYPQRLNTIVTDECIDSKEPPCQDQMITCDYKWPQSDETVTALLRDGGTYNINIHNYKVGQRQIVAVNSPDKHFITFPGNVQTGLKEVMNYLNEHYVTNEALLFAYNATVGGSQDVITITRYACQDFSFEFDVNNEANGTVVFTQKGTFIRTPDGVLEQIMEAGNCTNS